MENSKKRKIVNFVWSTVLSLIFGAICALALLCLGSQELVDKENIFLIVIYAILWGILLPNVCKYRLNDVLKTLGISVCISAIVSFALYYKVDNESVRLILAFEFFMLTPTFTSVIFRSISDKRDCDNSPEMESTKRAVEWWTQHLINAGIVNEETIKNFKRCLTDELYSYSRNNDSFVIASEYGILERLTNNLDIPYGVLPKDVVMVISFRCSTIYYTKLSEKKFI